MLFLYSLAQMIFVDDRIALICGVTQLCFLPLIYQNVQALRDIWMYYGTLILLWGLVAYLWNRGSLWHVFGASVAAGICQYIRPPIFFSFIGCSFVLFLYAIMQPSVRIKIGKILMIMWIANMSVFWVPFIMYNKKAYGRAFVSPGNQGLLEGMGEFSNKWGYKLSDAWVSQFISKKYNVRYGTPEFDDRAREEFLKAFKEDPGHFFRSVLQRIPLLLFPGLPINNYSNVIDPVQYSSLWEKVITKASYFFSSWTAFFEFLFRQIGVRLFILLGYAGLVLILSRRHFLASALLFAGGIMPSYVTISSHIEYRFLTPSYGLFVFFVGYAVYEFFRRKGYLL